MGVTAKSRASTSLDGDTALEPKQVIDLIREVAGSVKGGGASLLTTGFANAGAQVNVVRASGTSLRMSLTSGKQLVELCTFSATARANGDGRTVLRVGGLETYRTQQEKLLFLVPVGPKQIYGMAPYKKFLAAIQSALQAKDPSASVAIAQAAA